MNDTLTCVIILGKKDVASLPQSIYDSIKACEPDNRRVLYSNIVLSGGTSSFDGLPKRLDYEIEELAPHLKKNRDTGKDMVNVMSGKKIFFKPKRALGIAFGMYFLEKMLLAFLILFQIKITVFHIKADMFSYLLTP